MSNMLPADKAGKSTAKPFNRCRAHREGYCHLKSCHQDYFTGDRIVLARWGLGSEDWGSFHEQCYDDLPEFASLPPQLPLTEADGAPRVRAGKLPDGERHRGNRYALYIDDDLVMTSGNAKEIVGALKFCQTYLGLTLEVSDEEVRA